MTFNNDLLSYATSIEEKQKNETISIPITNDNEFTNLGIVE